MRIFWFSIVIIIGVLIKYFLVWYLNRSPPDPPEPSIEIKPIQNIQDLEKILGNDSSSSDTLFSADIIIQFTPTNTTKVDQQQLQQKFTRLTNNRNPTLDNYLCATYRELTLVKPDKDRVFFFLFAAVLIEAQTQNKPNTDYMIISVSDRELVFEVKDDLIYFLLDKYTNMGTFKKSFAVTQIKNKLGKQTTQADFLKKIKDSMQTIIKDDLLPNSIKNCKI